VYPVTQDFHNKMAARTRKVDVKVVIDYTDIDIDQSIDVHANEVANVSYPSQTADGLSEPFAKIASLDGSWVLDGTYVLAPANEREAANMQMGWWGNALAGSGGVFSSPYPALTIKHIPRPVHTLTVAGDSARCEYPVDFSISLYGPDNTLLRTETATGNNSVHWQRKLGTPVLDVTKQVLEITKWSHEGRQAKVLEFFTSIQGVYRRDNVAGLSLFEEREASHGSLPVGNITSNELVLKLSNKDKRFDVDNKASPLWGLLKPNRRIRAWLGAEGDLEPEWVPLGTFWSIDWDSPDDTFEAHVTARDGLERLRTSPYEPGEVKQDTSLYDLAEAVLGDAGLEPLEYAIDERLKDTIIPWAYLLPTTHREALRTIAEAGLAVVYADREGIIRIERYEERPGAPVFEITKNNYFPPLSAPSKQSEVANEIIVTTQPRRPANTLEEVYKSSEPVTVPANDEITVTAKYNQPPVIEAVASLDNPPAGVSVVDTEYLAWGAKVTIQNTTSNDEGVALVINGKPLAVQGAERVTARDNVSITENGVLQFEYPANYLVQRKSQAQEIANLLLPSVKDPRRDIEVEWRGDPSLELGDRVSIMGQEAVVIRQEIKWPSTRLSKITGRRAT
jgi:hypothetical protein